ncbi:pilus assembly protein N-terminal domain-containing protein [Avibacterium sp. 21-595]|uniref:type II and III secretion system protein family protein n=1 Tax=Avibacterium sp. 21-595 TaxID=2911527 RepID=UPI002026EB5F|nr:pilus assembly protein N-terminal domain-containing protein [Avibacterium sp. 21-595]URL05581.1 pilus assembly protein N-terminal domain-containing protein [Avibacterium sp. 21-595]
MQFSIFKLARAALVVGAVFPLSVSAQVFNMEDGQSRTLQTKSKIDTIFISSPDVADYEIIGDNSFIIYAKGEGVSEITVLDEEGNELRNDTINVNGMMKGLDRANQQIRLAFPNTNLSVKRVGQAYVIEGKAKSAVEQQEVTRIVGEALGASKETIKREVDINGNGEKEHVPFLDEYRYSNVVDASTTNDSAQINVQLSVVEVSKKLTDEMGINWSWSDYARALSPSSSTESHAWLVGATNGVGSLAYAATHFATFIRALRNDSKGRVLAEPNISLLSGEVGGILIGGEVPIVRYDRDGRSEVTYKDFGIKLNVAAKLLKDRRIRVLLSQEVSNISNQSQTKDGLLVPVFESRRSRSTFEVPDGGSFILGGLYNETDRDVIAKTPFLADIPVLGAFFRSVDKNRDKRELIVVATVYLVKPTRSDAIVYPSYKPTGLLEDMLKLPIPDDTRNFFRQAGFSQ